MAEDILLNDDMSNVPAADDAVPEGQYHLRVSNVQHQTENAKHEPANNIVFTLKIQTEDPGFGRVVTMNCDMNDSRGKSNLKTIYKAVGYNPGPEGHNPVRTLDGEFNGTVKHNIKDGVTYANVIPWSIKPLVS